MNQKIDVNITPNSLAMPTLYFSQGDIGRVYLIEVVSSDGYDIPSGATVKIEATKPSGFGFSVTGTVTDNTVEIVSTAEMTDEAGRFFAKLEISSGGVVLGTANFCMSGQPDTHPEGTIDGSQETIIPQLTVMVERVENAAAAVLNTTTIATTLPAGSQATYSFDEETNTATFGIPQGEAGAGAAGVVANAYSASKTYAVGDYAIHNSNLYRCTTAITTAEAFTASHWTQVVLADDVTDLKNDLTQETNARTVADNALSTRITDNDTDISALQTSVTNLGTHKVAQPLDGNNQPTNGTSGQSLRTKGDGTTEWADVGLPTNAQTAEAVSAWLDEHPEATTTVQDGSLTEAKFTDALKLKTIKDYVTPEMFGAKGDGVTDDTTAVRSALAYPCVYFANSYVVSEPIDAYAVAIFGEGRFKTTDSFLICKNDVQIEDISIEQTADESSVAILCEKSAIINNVKIDKGLGGIRSIGSYYPCEIMNCKITNMYGDTSFGIDVQFAGDTIIANNTIENISNALDRDADGIKTWQGEDSQNYPHVLITNNELHNCRGRFIKASTANVSVIGNYCHNDSNFSVITAFMAIDVQKGNSKVSENIIVASGGIHVAFRFYATQHIISDNVIDFESRSSNTAPIDFDSYDSALKCQAVMERNKIHCTNVAVTMAYGSHTYILRDIKHTGRSNNVSVAMRGTANQTTRLEFYNCWGDYAFFAIFNNIIPNMWGENCKVRCTADQTALTTLPRTRYFASFNGASVALRTIDVVVGSSFLIEIASATAYKIYNASGDVLVG